MAGPIEWSTPRKAPVLQEALKFRRNNGSVKKLCFLKRQSNEEWPSQSTLSTWIKHHDTLIANGTDERTAFEESCRRRGRVNRTGRPRKLDANVLNELASSQQNVREESQLQWCKRAGVSRWTLQRAQRNRIPPIVRSIETRDEEIPTKTVRSRSTYAYNYKDKTFNVGTKKEKNCYTEVGTKFGEVFVRQV